MPNPIRSAEDAIDEITLFENWLGGFIERTLAKHLGHKKVHKKARLLDDIGGVRTVIQILNGVQMPKGYDAVQVGCTPPTFEQITTKGRDGVKAIIAIEIIALKEEAS